MKFKKVYIEICNGCNLNCDCCIKNSRQVKYIKRDEYEYIINKIAGYTKEIYLHVLGEPLMHKDIIIFTHIIISSILNFSCSTLFDFLLN